MNKAEGEREITRSGGAINVGRRRRGQKDLEAVPFLSLRSLRSSLAVIGGDTGRKIENKGSMQRKESGQRWV